MAFLVRLLRVVFTLGALTGSLFALLAFFGFASPWLDVINHLQILLFGGTLICLLLTPLILPEGRARAFILAMIATGFVASSVAVVPEALSSFAPRPPMPEDGRPVLKLMTHNLFGVNEDMPRVAAVVAAESPDIIALQEFFPEQSRDLDPLLSPNYPYSVRCFGGKRANIALYSKLPFQQSMDGACSENPSAGERTAHIVATFTLATGQRFSVVTTHVDWPVPPARQQAELEAVATTMSHVDAPALLVGDFNSTPWSYALRGFGARAGLVRHTRSVLTYPKLWFYFDDWRPAIPVLPLDQVFSKGLVAVHELHTAAATGSDHLPVVLTFSLSGPESARS